MDYTIMAESFLQKGYCCTEAIIRFGLALRNEENEQMACASSALCKGIQSGCSCGALAGGAMLLALFDKRAATEEMIPALSEWFDNQYGMIYGSVNCEDIAGRNLEHRALRCKPIILSVCETCINLLTKNDLL